MANETTLREYLSGRKCKSFNPVPHYFQDGDFLTYYFDSSPCYEQRVDDLLTIYLSLANDELVGCKIKGVRRLVNQDGGLGVQIEDENVSLLVLIERAQKQSPEADEDKYRQVSQLAKSATIPSRELPLAAAA